MRLYLADLIDTMRLLPDRSVNAIITDFPYAVLTARRNEWDRLIDYEAFWKEVERIGFPNTPVISTAQQPFTSVLVATNFRDFKYALVWEKSKATGYLNAKKQPMRAHEDIIVFYRKQCVYNPQMTSGKPYDKGTAVRDTTHYNEQTKAIHVKNEDGTRYPRSVQYFKTAESEGKLHPTQKPVALFEWLVKTYTNEGDVVLDPCMGSGTTGLACLNTSREFIGIERDAGWFATSEKRLREAGAVIEALGETVDDEMPETIDRAA